MDLCWHFQLYNHAFGYDHCICISILVRWMANEFIVCSVIGTRWKRYLNVAGLFSLDWNCRSCKVKKGLDLFTSDSKLSGTKRCMLFQYNRCSFHSLCAEVIDLDFSSILLGFKKFYWNLEVPLDKLVNKHKILTSLRGFSWCCSPNARPNYEHSK